VGGNSGLINLIWTLLSLGYGAPGPWTEEDRTEDPAPTFIELLERATGIDSMRANPAGAASWIPPDFDLAKFTQDLQSSGAFEIADMSRPIRKATDAALEQARADAAMFCDRLNTIGRVLEELRDEEIPWLKALSVLAPQSAFDRSSLIRNMLILRTLAGGDALAMIAALVESEHARFKAIGEIRAALPQHGAILRADTQQRLAKLPPTKAAEVQADVARYLSEHPETAKALAFAPAPGQERQR